MIKKATIEHKKKWILEGYKKAVPPYKGEKRERTLVEQIADELERYSSK